MLSEEEKRELKAMAASAAVREEFQRLRKMSELPRDQSMNLDELVSFLSLMSRVCPTPSTPRPFIRYTRVLL